MNDLVLYARHERVAVLTLNRPEKRNALSPELVSTLSQSLQRAQDDPEVGAIVLTGAGDKAFCAGADLGAPSGDGLLGMHHGRRGFADLLHAMSQCRKPLVGAATGLALAGGFGLLMACDLVVVAKNARLGTPEIKRGLFPMMIVAVLLRTLGRRRTLELALTGQEIDGATLERWGGCNEALDNPADVLPRAQAIALGMSGFSSAILALGRQAVFAVEDMSFSQQLDYLRQALTLNTLAEDAGEGIAAFFEKRAPAWKGR
jgi:enoyl-CoA hydratase